MTRLLTILLAAICLADICQAKPALTVRVDGQLWDAPSAWLVMTSTNGTTWTSDRAIPVPPVLNPVLIYNINNGGEPVKLFRVIQLPT